MRRMHDMHRTVAWIHDELGRLGCREISLSMQAGLRLVLLTRGEESSLFDPEQVRRALFLLRSYAGDDAVWKALQELAGRET